MISKSTSMMPPPGAAGHGVAIIIAAHPAGPDKGNGKMPPPGMKMPDDDESPEQQPGASGAKASPDEAKVVREDQHCVNCRNYDATSGDCAKVQGSFQPDDGCHMWFAPIDGDEDQDEPDADDQGGPPDNDADDQQGAPAQQ